MQIYLYPLNSLEDLETTIDQGCGMMPVFEADPTSTQQAVLCQVDAEDVFALGTFVQDYFSMANYVLLYEVKEADPCEPKSK